MRFCRTLISYPFNLRPMVWLDTAGRDRHIDRVTCTASSIWVRPIGRRSLQYRRSFIEPSKMGRLTPSGHHKPRHPIPSASDRLGFLRTAESRLCQSRTIEHTARTPALREICTMFQSDLAGTTLGELSIERVIGLITVDRARLRAALASEPYLWASVTLQHAR